MGPQISAAPTQYVPFWRDGRVLGVFGQIGFIILVALVVRTLGANFASNVDKLGETQFLCADGSTSYRCAYDFMNTQAGFDISEAPLPYDITDSYWYAFTLGVINTLKVGLLGVLLTTIVGTFAGIARLSSNWLISRIALWYVELMRNLPLLIVLFILYFGALLSAPDLRDSAQPLGLPIYLNNRGLNFPWPKLTTSAATWLAFLVLGVIQYQVLMIVLSRREELTGKAISKFGWGVLSFLIVIVIGWFVAGSLSDTQGLLATKASRIREVEDIEQLMIQRTGVNLIGEIDDLPEEEMAAAAMTVCVLRDSPSEANFISQLRGMGIPNKITRFDRPDQATEAYAEGSCEVFAAPKSVLAAERGTLENPNGHLVVHVSEKPVVWSVPAFEGLNLAGGTKLTPEFTALLFGLTLFYGASLAELVRAGIQSVSKGQSEAARALGLTEGQRMRLVVLPQSLRVVIPPLIGTYASLVKDTSLGIALGFSDMYRVSYVTINQSGRALQLVVLMMLVYLGISITFSLILNWYNTNYVVIAER
jgi:general L-amino acid transport system permease protein